MRLLSSAVQTALVLGILLYGSPAPAQELTQTPGSGVMVEQCNPHQHEPGSGGHVWVDPYGRYHGIRNFPYTAGFLGVTYTNNAKKAAREVDFGLVSRGSLIAVRRDTRKVCGWNGVA